MPTYLHNAVRELNAYGYGDTRNGVTPYATTYEGFPEYIVHKNQSFFIETGFLNVPALPPAPIQGAFITYCNPGWSYRARSVFRPTFVPFRKDFILTSDGFENQTLEDFYNRFNNIGNLGRTELDRVVFNVKAAGFISWGRRTYFNNNFKEMLIGANGMFTVQYVAFPYTNVNNPRPVDNYDGIQVGSMIKFFTEDEFSIIVFDRPQDIGTSINTLP